MNLRPKPIQKHRKAEFAVLKLTNSLDDILWYRTAMVSWIDGHAGCSYRLGAVLRGMAVITVFVLG